MMSASDPLVNTFYTNPQNENNNKSNTSSPASSSHNDTQPLELHSTNPNSNASIQSTTTTPSPQASIEERYESERQQTKIRNWQESPYAVGLVEATWADELARFRSQTLSSSSNNGGPCGDSCNDEIDPTCGCIKLSAIVCTKLGAKRVGNMAILKESVETVLEDDDDDDDNLEGMEKGSARDGKKRTRVVFRRKMDIVVGPYWPMLVFITYPIIFGVSIWTATVALPGKHPFFILFWLCSTLALCYALFSTGCRDPGIFMRKREVPPQAETSRWRWNDQALTWRPRGAIYDPDCACVVEEFDHTCPWTGTAIGKKNMSAFKSFLFFTFFNLIMDVYLLTSTTL